MPVHVQTFTYTNIIKTLNRLRNTVTNRLTQNTSARVFKDTNELKRIDLQSAGEVSINVFEM